MDRRSWMRILPVKCRPAAATSHKEGTTPQQNSWRQTRAYRVGGAAACPTVVSAVALRLALVADQEEIQKPHRESHRVDWIRAKAPFACRYGSVWRTEAIGRKE